MKLSIIFAISFVVLSLDAMQQVPSLKELSVPVAAKKLTDQYTEDNDKLIDRICTDFPQEIADSLVLEIVSFRVKKTAHSKHLFIRSILCLEGFESIYEKLLDRNIEICCNNSLSPFNYEPYFLCTLYSANEKFLNLVIKKYGLSPRKVLENLVMHDKHQYLQNVVRASSYNINESTYHPQKQTVLHWAVEYNKVDCVKELLKLGARDTADMSGKRASDLAREKNYKTIAHHIENYKHQE